MIQSPVAAWENSRCGLKHLRSGCHRQGDTLVMLGRTDCDLLELRCSGENSVVCYVFDECAKC